MYLASASPRRAALLADYHIPFKQISNQLKSETVFYQPMTQLRSQLRYLALEKAIASKGSYKGWILGADTVVVFKNTLMGKPTSPKQALDMLTTLSGKTHKVITAFALYNSQTAQTITRSCVTTVTFRQLSPKTINAYINSGNAIDKAGAYGIQDIGDEFVHHISGSISNVIGLPMESLLTVCRMYGIVNT